MCAGVLRLDMDLRDNDRLINNAFDLVDVDESHTISMSEFDRTLDVVLICVVCLIHNTNPKIKYLLK